MFAPEGYFPFAASMGWLDARVEDFYLECALPMAKAQSVDADDDAFSQAFALALASKILYREWLIDMCLFFQPAPVYLASPAGQVIQAAPHFFRSDLTLSSYEFDWPLSKSELLPAAKTMAAEHSRTSDPDYYFFSMSSCCIELPTDEEAESLPRDIQPLRRAIAPFDGWSVCFKNTDGERLEEVLKSLFHWDEEEKCERQRGRPKKRDAAAAIYRSLFPGGHEVQGITWDKAREKVEKAGNIKVSLDTLRLGLAEK